MAFEITVQPGESCAIAESFCLVIQCFLRFLGREKSSAFTGLPLWIAVRPWSKVSEMIATAIHVLRLRMVAF